MDDVHITKVDPDDLEFLGPIGVGGQGLVRRARMHSRGDVDVAVKRSTAVLSSAQQTKRFLMEIAMLNSLHHACIVDFYGCCYVADGDFAGLW